MMISNRMMWALVAVAAGAAVGAAFVSPARTRRQELFDDSTRVDEASEDSFPASDPPSFSAPAVAVSGPNS